MGRQFLNGVVGVVAVVLSTIGEIELAGLNISQACYAEFCTINKIKESHAAGRL
jgi:hypothetical protein